MRVLVIGGGGREHAVIRKLRENPEITEIFALPGNAGMRKEATCVAIGAKDIPAIVSFARDQKIDYAVVTPDDPLVLGCVDALEELGIPCFGPRANAAIIEGSKVFAKNLMKRYGIPTAKYESFDDMDKALRYLKTAPMPTVVKADGLALGKGVIIARTREEACAAVTDMMQGGKFGKKSSLRSSSKGRKSQFLLLRTGRAWCRWSRVWTISAQETAIPVSTPAAWAPLHRTHTIRKKSRSAACRKSSCRRWQP